MAKNDFPKIKPTEKYPLGHAKENKDASKYAKNGMSVAASNAPMVDGGEYVTTKSVRDAGLTDPLPNGVSMGTAKLKTEGITMRGYGAATKGIKSRGPMA